MVIVLHSGDSCIYYCYFFAIYGGYNTRYCFTEFVSYLFQGCWKETARKFKSERYYVLDL